MKRNPEFKENKSNEKIALDEEEIARSGKIYDPNEPIFSAYQEKYLSLVDKYNSTSTSRLGLWRRRRLAKKIFAEFGENSIVEAPFRANFGGHHVHIGKNVYCNFNLVLVDDADIYIGDYTMIGPNVVIDSAEHPISPDLRRKGLEYNLKVHIGKNVWIGAGAVILPGVTIGDNSIIGAGAVVTKDVESGVVAVGIPARVMRKIDEKDYRTYNHGVSIPKEFLK